ncbi:Serine/threonine-protein kinase PrkC [Aquisphaera giovannonii]|uniref:Serine/threonine-protein kinase PrkC n=2 Tax=Aquisphaera giovannonii TaxID=406548 RepID=A0A5B9W4P3_9BACT|nr:Serine/threonine-protein kinase PrkC [Aquisphaera giovannonii]
MTDGNAPDDHGPDAGPALRAGDAEGAVDLAVYDFHAAVDRGEAPRPEDWVAAHPEIAGELAAYFDDLAAFAGPPGPGAEATRAHPAAGPGGGAGRAGLATRLDRPRPGDELGGYVLLERLGGGGQGEVWKARHLKSNDLVALKVLDARVESDGSSVRRLTDEARIIAALRHPNIIRIKYFDHDRGRWFISMDLMEGGTVADRYRGSPAPPEAAAALMEKVARAIHHAHTRNPGVLHLDLKPANVLLDPDGEPRVSDFGLAIRVESLATLAAGSRSTGLSPELDGESEADPAPGPDASAGGGPAAAPAPAPGAGPQDETVAYPVADAMSEEASRTLYRLGAVGTFPYMSPEMAAGRWADVSTASDVYGLGAILYAMLTGRPPFQGKDGTETAAMVIEGNLTPPRRLNPEVDAELQAICLKCLHRDPARRYGSADALANDLGRRLRGEPTVAGGPSTSKHLRFWARRHPFQVALAAIAFGVLAAAAGSFGQLRTSNAREAARLARDVDDKLRMIGRAIVRSARDPRLVDAFRRHDGSPRELRLALDAFLAEISKDYNYWFDLTDSQPLFNVYLVDPSGTLLADTIPEGERFLGRDFSRRDYFQGFRRPPLEGERHAYYVSRVYHSIKDDRYKVAIATRVWDEEAGRWVALLVANVTAGSQLVDLDMRNELPGAAVVSPPDWTYTEFEGTPPSRYVVLLSPDHATAGAPFDPIWRAASDVPLMASFEADPSLKEAVEYVHAGAMTDYHRVGRTPLVVVLRQPYSWPLRLIDSPWQLALVALVCAATVYCAWMRARRGRRAAS